MTKASDNVFPRLLISEGGSTSTPAAGNVTVYAKANGLLYSKDDAGAETALGAGLTNPMSAVGDIIQGTTAGAPAALAAPLAGKVLTGAGVTTPLVYAYPPGYQLDYVEKTSSTNITATSAATADTIITGTSQAYAAGDYWVEIFFPQARTDAGAAGRTLNFCLWDGSTDLGQVSELRTTAAAALGAAQLVRRKITLTAATHQLIAKGFVSAGTGIAGANTGGVGTLVPAYICVTTV